VLTKKTPRFRDTWGGPTWSRPLLCKDGSFGQPLRNLTQHTSAWHSLIDTYDIRYRQTRACEAGESIEPGA
jgi:hypothetical protein